MKIITSFFVVCILTAPAMAQAINEPFDTSSTGVFPPAGWTETNTGTPEIWGDTSATSIFAVPAGYPTADAAGHGYTGFAAIADSNLISPVMFLLLYGAPELTYDGGLGYSAYMSHTSIYFGTSDIEVSTDGGVTFSSVWSETAVADYWTPAITLDLTGSAANQPNVALRFRYQGEFAHEWVVDNVIVEDAGVYAPSLALLLSCPGSRQAVARHMTPGGPVVFAWGFSGSHTVVGGSCAGLTVPMASPTTIGIRTANAAGSAMIYRNQPASACGNVFVVAIDGATCVATPTVSI